MPELLAPGRAGYFSNRVREIQARGHLVFETNHLRRDGTLFPVEVSIRSFEYLGKPALLGTFRDVSERKLAEEKLHASLKEKEVLLKEIHHRVKNNLQVVSSLLFVQSQRISDPELAACFLESQSRIHSMAMAHEQLYRSKNLAEVSVKTYVEGLIENLRQVYFLPRREISWQLEAAEIVLNIEKVIPFGLLLTELLSNAHKHAFVDKKEGNVTISIRRCGEEIELAVADDGVGLPADFNYRETETLGMQLISALINQLNGTLELEQGNGTLFKVRFIS
jgi:two-component sensor histidine kinase